MGTVRCFEDLDAWRKAREPNRGIYAASNQDRFRRDFALCTQIRRASLSVMSNIAEGFERGGTAEFVQLLSVAKGSAGELRAQLYAALDQGYIDRTSFQRLNDLSDQVSRLIGGLMEYLRKSGMRGPKFRPVVRDGEAGTRGAVVNSEPETRNSKPGHEV